jgi:hypothetical protein
MSGVRLCCVRSCRGARSWVGLTGEIETLDGDDEACWRVMTPPGIGPIIDSAMVATIGAGSAFRRGRDLGAWLGLVLNSPEEPTSQPSPTLHPDALRFG